MEENWDSDEEEEERAVAAAGEAREEMEEEEPGGHGVLFPFPFLSFLCLADNVGRVRFGAATSVFLCLSFVLLSGGRGDEDAANGTADGKRSK